MKYGPDIKYVFNTSQYIQYFASKYLRRIFEKIRMKSDMTLV